MTRPAPRLTREQVMRLRYLVQGGCDLRTEHGAAESAADFFGHLRLQGLVEFEAIPCDGADCDGQLRIIVTARGLDVCRENADA